MKKNRKQTLSLKLDLGCGKNKKPGFIGVDAKPFPGVDVVHDLSGQAAFDRNGKLMAIKWPWPDGSVEEVHCSHFVEHLTAVQRVHFVNELYRVMKPGAKALIITPHAWSERAFGDLTHQWPPVVSFWFHYLSKAWREQNAPHNDFYTCDFAVTGNYILPGDLVSRPTEYQQYALRHYKESASDMMATFVKV